MNDCNDNNPAIHPDATEICNNLDDDCDGEVDEILANLTYAGNVNLNSQAAVNAWQPCYTIIQGNLTIQNLGMENLATLTNLRKVTGNVLIKQTGLDSLSWLMALDTIGGNLLIMNNNQEESIHGLDSLKSIGASLQHHHNLKCDECCAIYDLLNTPGAIGAATNIFLNKTGCSSVGQINAACAPGSNLLGPNGTENRKFSNSLCPDCASADGNIGGLSIYPNPASTSVNVHIGNPSGGRLKIVNVAGKVVYESWLETGQNGVKIATGNWEPGIYIVHCMLETASLYLQSLSFI